MAHPEIGGGLASANGRASSNNQLSALHPTPTPAHSTCRPATGILEGVIGPARVPVANAVATYRNNNKNLGRINNMAGLYSGSLDR
jgi:hypothetical protein